MSTTFDVTDAVMNVGPVVYGWNAEFGTPVGGPDPVTDKGSVVEGPVLGEVPARGTAGTYPQGCLFVPSFASFVALVAGNQCFYNAE